MKTVKGIHAAYRAMYERVPREFSAQMTHDDEGRIISVELPGGAAVAFSADEMRVFLNDIERRKHDQL